MYGSRKLRMVTQIAKILGKEGLRNLDFEILRCSKVTAQQAIMLNRVEEELPSTPNISKADEIELWEIMAKAMKSTENLIVQFKGQMQLEETLPMHELLGLDKELRSIRG